MDGMIRDTAYRTIVAFDFSDIDRTLEIINPRHPNLYPLYFEYLDKIQQVSLYSTISLETKRKMFMMVSAGICLASSHFCQCKICLSDKIKIFKLYITNTAFLIPRNDQIIALNDMMKYGEIDIFIENNQLSICGAIMLD